MPHWVCVFKLQEPEWTQVGVEKRRGRWGDADAGRGVHKNVLEP